MHFTALHQALGEDPGPITEEMLDAAIASGVPESGGLDWKDRLPAIKGLAGTEVPKDIAAMANAGGGVIIYGVNEEDKKATSRSDKATYDGSTAERYERAYKSAAVSAIYPPVFGVELVEISTSPLAVAAIVPASVDGPHLVYRQDLFGAPVRNGADTVWMREGDIARMYRARFDEQRNATEALKQLYADAASAADGERVWLVGVARPRLAVAGVRLTREEAGAVFRRANELAVGWGERDDSLPYGLPGLVEREPRVGLRRWVLPGLRALPWRDRAEVALHRDGAVSVAFGVGGPWGYQEGGAQVELPGDHFGSIALETGVLELCALVRATALRLGLDEYELELGLVWEGEMVCMPRDRFWVDRFRVDEGVRIRGFSPVQATMRAGASASDFHQQVLALAGDCVNQVGTEELSVVYPEPSPAGGVDGLAQR